MRKNPYDERVSEIHGPLAHLVEHFHGMEGVAGSNPAWSTINSNGKGSGNGSFPFGVTCEAGLEGGSPIERTMSLRMGAVSVPAWSTYPHSFQIILVWIFIIKRNE